MLENLYNYYHNDMTREQIENAYTLLNDDNRLLYYTCYAYNCYELLHSKGHLQSRGQNDRCTNRTRII